MKCDNNITKHIQLASFNEFSSSLSDHCKPSCLQEIALKLSKSVNKGRGGPPLLNALVIFTRYYNSLQARVHNIDSISQF